jgi:hypothetical protein
LLNSAGERTTTFPAGDPVRIAVEYHAHEALEDVSIEVFFYSVFGNLHSHFSTATDGRRLDLKQGTGVIEFSCPEIGLEVAAFNVEASVKYRTADFTDRIDHKHGAVINIGQGKPIHGLFHTAHTWQQKQADSN